MDDAAIGRNNFQLQFARDLESRPNKIQRLVIVNVVLGQRQSGSSMRPDALSSRRVQPTWDSL